MLQAEYVVANDPPQEPSEAQRDRKALIETVRTAHQTVCEAGRTALRAAIEAGAALLRLKKLVNHGEWAHFLRRHCELGERTAQIYIQLAVHRELIEANPQRAADLSLRGALKLISGKASANKSDKSAQSNKTAELSSLAFMDATVEARCLFVDAIGLIAWLAAMPPAWIPELERRIDGQRAATAATVEGKLVKTLSKALRQALSLQKTTQNKDNTSASVAAALNGFLSKLNTAGLDFNDLDVVVRVASATRKRAA